MDIIFTHTLLTENEVDTVKSGVLIGSLVTSAVIAAIAGAKFHTTYSKHKNKVRPERSTSETKSV